LTGLARGLIFLKKGLAPRLRLTTVHLSFGPHRLVFPVRAVRSPVLFQNFFVKSLQLCLTARFRVALVEGFPFGE
jgi:hypothetical protein